MTCECHDTEQEHEAWFEKEAAYWRAYFGDNLEAFGPPPTQEELEEMLALKR